MFGTAAVVVPESTVTDEGKDINGAAAWETLRPTTIPSIGAGRDSVTVPDAAVPPTTEAGEILKPVTVQPVLTVSERLVVFVNRPLVPVIVSTELPMVAVSEAVSVSTEVAVDDDGLNEAVTPVGRPPIEYATDPVKPPDAVTDMADVAFCPCSMVRPAGLAAIVKLPFTVRLSVVVRVSPAPIPVMVTTDAPVAAVRVAESTIMADVLDVPGLNSAVTPLGRPLAEKLTALVKPTVGTTVTVDDPAVPWLTVSDAGVAANV